MSTCQTQDSTAAPVLLLKTKSVPADGYEEELTNSSHYLAEFVPVLEHRLKQDRLSDIEDLIVRGAFGSSEFATYGGLIFTSQRAVEAFTVIVDRLRTSGVDLAGMLPKAIPLYVVGPATARGLRALELECRIVGEETGNGDALAQFILSDFNSNGPRKRSLLFLVGEKRRDVIPVALQSEHLGVDMRISVDEIVVYETGELASLADDFKIAFERAKRVNDQRQWVVVFSPAGCKAVLQILGLDQGQKTGAKTARVATIGPTTQNFLQVECGYKADAVAPSPSPLGLLQAMDEHDHHSRQEIQGL